MVAPNAERGEYAVSVRSRTTGKTWTFEPGDEADLRRSPEAAVPLENPAISRISHARLIWESGRAFLISDGETRGGIYVQGVRNARVEITGRMVVRLGTDTEGEDLELDKVATTQRAAPPGRDDRPRRDEHESSTRPDQKPQGGAHADITAPAPIWGAKGPPLTVTVGTVNATLPGELHKVYRLGRNSDCEVHVDDPTVSREHLELMWDGNRWTVLDRSTKGTFRSDQRPLAPGQRVPFDGPLDLRLGDPVSGEPATLTPAGSRAPGPAPKHRTLMLVAAVVAVLIALSGTTFALTRGGQQDGGGGEAQAAIPGVLTDAALDQVRGSVVRLTSYGKVFVTTGSGTIISSDGLILTNAHVADPVAAGLDAQYGFGFTAGKESVDYLVVGITEKPDSPVKELYRAKLLVSDGYLDLAVVKIYAKADGSRLDGPLDLPALPIGNSDETSTGDELVVLGFPAAASSESIVVNKGEVAGLVEDPHLDSNRAFFDSSATVRHGNSGGTAVNSDGELIGIPTRLFCDPSPCEVGSDQSQRVRPVNWAEDIIKIAESGGDLDYISTWLVEPTGHENVEFLGLTAEKYYCVDDKSKYHASAQSGMTSFYSTFFISGAAKHLDLFPVVFKKGFPIPPADPSIYGDVGRNKGICLFVDVHAKEGLPDGTYSALLYSGANADKLLGFGKFTVGPG